MVCCAYLSLLACAQCHTVHTRRSSPRTQDLCVCFWWNVGVISVDLSCEYCCTHTATRKIILVQSFELLQSAPCKTWLLCWTHFAVAACMLMHCTCPLLYINVRVFTALLTHTAAACMLMHCTCTHCYINVQDFTALPNTLLLLHACWCTVHTLLLYTYRYQGDPQ
jgi:hypothetical protein